jgi:hypothetical protein
MPLNITEENNRSEMEVDNSTVAILETVMKYDC